MKCKMQVEARRSQAQEMNLLTLLSKSGDEAKPPDYPGAVRILRPHVSDESTAFPRSSASSAVSETETSGSAKFGRRARARRHREHYMEMNRRAGRESDYDKGMISLSVQALCGILEGDGDDANFPSYDFPPPEIRGPTTEGSSEAGGDDESHLETQPAENTLCWAEPAGKQTQASPSYEIAAGPERLPCPPGLELQYEEAGAGSEPMGDESHHMSSNAGLQFWRPGMYVGISDSGGLIALVRCVQGERVHVRIPDLTGGSDLDMAILPERLHLATDLGDWAKAFEAMKKREEDKASELARKRKTQRKQYEESIRENERTEKIRQFPVGSWVWITPRPEELVSMRSVFPDGLRTIGRVSHHCQDVLRATLWTEWGTTREVERFHHEPSAASLDEARESARIPRSCFPTGSCGVGSDCCVSRKRKC
jgi:hypothetical protein